MPTFSSKVKKELSEINNLSNKNLVKAELMGYISTHSSKTFSTENQYNINRYGKLLNNIGQDDFKIYIKGNKFIIETQKKINPQHEIKNDEEKKAFIRGAFLSAGSISDPQKIYHLEIIFETEENSTYTKELLEEKQIKSKTTKRAGKTLLYIEDGENIATFLALIGANKCMLEFEETRVIKEVRNKVNRMVNCETANMKKSINTAVKQIENIKLIKQKNEFQNLSEKEQQLANLRLENPEASINELAKLATPQMSKSGAHHVMDRISKYADKLKGASS